MYNSRNKNKGVKIKLGILCAFFAVLLSCAVALLCGSFSASKTAQNAPADLDEITLPEKSASSAIAGGNASDDGSISAPALEAKATAAADMAAAWETAVANNGTFNLTEDWTASSDYGGFGNSSYYYGGALYVPSGKTVTINLSGHTLNRNNPSSDSSVIHIEGNLTINDTVGGGTITGGTGYYYSSPVNVASGSLTLNSGKISGNHVSGGSGDAYGGGVGVHGGIFYMYGGEISGNTAQYGKGGGVGVDGGSFIMSGGTISGNNADRGGGGVVVVSGTFNMTGGTITNNIDTSTQGNGNYGGGGGVYVMGGFVTMSGSPNISGNKSNGANNDVYLRDGNSFVINGGFVSGAHIGISSPGIITSDYSRFNNADPTDFFFSNSNIELFLYDGEVCMATDRKMLVWAAAVLKSLQTGRQQTVTLTENWTATAVDGMSENSFGEGSGFSGGAIFVPAGANIVLDLNGHTIDRHMTGVTGTSNGNVIKVQGTLEITDTSTTQNGKIIGGYTSWGGGGVYVESSGGKFILSGGTISGNTCTGTYGGGVSLYLDATFIMNGGAITGNTCTKSDGAGGVFLMSRSKFTMNGGTISGNTNTQTYTGRTGGVRSGGTFTMNGGAITGNTGLGVYVENNAAFRISGSVQITGNSGGNVSLYSSSTKIRIDGVLTGSKIGISGTSTEAFTSGYSTFNNGIAPAVYFVSDSGKVINLSSGEAVIGTGSASTGTALTWKYSTSSSGTYTALPSDGKITYTGSTYYVKAYNGTTEVTINSSVYKDVNGNTVTSIRSAGTYSFAVNSASYTNSSFNLTITQRTVTVSWGSTTFSYNGNQQFPKATLNNVLTSDSISLAVDTSNAGTDAGNDYSVKITGLSGINASNYKFASGTVLEQHYTIYKAQLAKPTASGSFNYNGEQQTYTVGGYNSTLMTLGGTYTATNAGDYTATVSIKDTNNYQWTDYTTDPVNIDWTINKLYIFVAGISVENKPYDGTTSATVDTSGVKLIGVVEADKANLGLSFTAGTEFDGAAVGLHSVAITGVELTGTAAGNYILEADEVTGYAQIYPATVTISGVVANGKEYDGTTAVTFNTNGATITGAVEGEVSSLIANLTAEGYFNNKNAGEGVAVSVISYILGGDYAGNYYIDFAKSETSLTADITPAQVEVTLGKTEYKVTYGNALKITYSQNSPVKSESVTLALKYLDEAGNIELSGVPTDAGTYRVEVTVDPNDENLANYVVKKTGEGIIPSATVIIERAILTVTVEDLEIEYGDAVPAADDYTLVYNGWLNGDKSAFEDGDITFIQNIVISTTYTAGSDADGYDITLSGGELKNYELNPVDGVLWVMPKQVTVKIHNTASVYGEDDAELTSNGAADIGITLEREEGTAVGKYVISGNWDNDNYDVTFINGVYEITKATLTVTANANTITYGEVASDNGVEYGDFAYDEDENVLLGTLQYRYTYTQYGNVYEDGTDEEIAYYIIPYGLTSDNYEIIFVNGLLTVNQKAATVTVSNVSGDITNTPADREEAAKKVKYAVDGTVNGDDLIVQINIASTGVLKEGNVTQGVNWFAVGSYDITATFNNPNYIVSFNYENGATKGTYMISKGTLILTANTLIITYGDAVAFPADLDEALSAEGLPSGSTLADLFGTAISGTLSVLPYGDAAYAEYAAMGSAYQLGDDIFDASGNRISYVVIPTGLASSSYTIIFKPGKLLVEPKSITVTLDDKNGVYGEELKELTASTTGLVNYDNSVSVAEFLGITGLAKASGTDAGNYAITATGSTNKNYRVTFVNGVYTVEQYEVTLVWVSGNDDPDKFEYEYNGGEFSPVATFEMHGTTYSSADDEATRLIEIMGSGVNAGDYKAQAFLLNSNLKFSTAQDNKTTKEFTVKARQLTVKWYKTSDDIGDAEKVLDTSDVVSYNYRVGDPWAPVAVIEGVADEDKSIVSIEVSGKQNSVNKGNPYVAELWIHGSNNYTVAQSDKTIEFVIVMVAPGDFKWEGETSYVYSGEAQQPVATASNNAYFIYVVELLDEDGEAVKTVATAISVGKYRITAEPKDVNFQIPADKTSYEFEITPFVATAVWSATSFEYNGAKQVPTAYYLDVHGQHVELEVTLADGENGTDGGSDYHVSVTLNTPNYTFKDGGEFVTTLEKTYTITQKNIVVVWESKYNGTDDKWVAEYKNSDESESVSFVATMNNEAEPLDLDVKVYWQANAGDEPVEVNKVHDAGIYTWRVALAKKNGAVNGNYTVVNAEQTFEITRPRLTVKAANQTVNTGAPVQSLTATFEGFVNGETAESLGLEADGKCSWLDTNYNRNSAYLEASAYDAPAYKDLQTLADLNGVKGYFVVLSDSEVKLNALNGLLKNYDWSFEYGKVIIVAVEGDVKIITVKEYNGEDQKPGAQYKNTAGNWVDLNVVVYEDETYSKIVENAEVKNVDTYYLLLKKFDDDNTPLAGAEKSGKFVGCVKKTFTITKRQIEIKISDNGVEYGTVTRSDYENYLSWSYANEDPNHKPLAGDGLGIVLDLALAANSFDGGDYLNAGVYAIVGSWNEDMTNYEVTFIGSDGDKGVFEVSLAQISFKEAGEYNQVIEEDGRLTMSLGEMNGDGTSYVNFSFAGFQNTDLVEIYYSNPYNLDKNDPDKFAPDKDETVTETTSPIFYRTGNDSRYFVNFKIVIPNHEPYYGQWKALVLVDTIYIRILFVDGKTYDVVYGDALPDGKTLATELWDNGYIDKLSTGIQNSKFKEYIESGLVTAKVVTDDAAMTRGSYSIIFEGFENVEDGKYQVIYKENITDPDSKATNVGKYVVNRRDLTITWDKTSFVYDGEAHLPVPEITGWVRAEDAETVNGATVYTFTNAALGKTITLTVKTNGGDFTTVGSENVIIASVDDDNYALDRFNATRAVSILGESAPLPADPTDPTEPVDPVNTIVQEGVAEWIVWVLGIVAVLALFVIFVLAAKSRKPKALNDADGFYDDIDENS